MHSEENFASVANASDRQPRFGAPLFTPLLAPMRSPLEKQFPISYQLKENAKAQTGDKL